MCNGCVPAVHVLCMCCTHAGATLYDPLHKQWFMWATELTSHCGMHTWTTNSHTVRAVSNTSTGNYVREAEQFGIWSHEVDVVRAPTGQYVAYFSHMPTGKAPACAACTDGSTNPACKKEADIEVSPPTYMSYSLGTDPRGNWSEPVLVLMPKPMMDINVAPVIHQDGWVPASASAHVHGRRCCMLHAARTHHWLGRHRPCGPCTGRDVISPRSICVGRMHRAHVMQYHQIPHMYICMRARARVCVHAYIHTCMYTAHGVFFPRVVLSLLRVPCAGRWWACGATTTRADTTLLRTSSPPPTGPIQQRTRATPSPQLCPASHRVPPRATTSRLKHAPLLDV